MACFRGAATVVTDASMKHVANKFTFPCRGSPFEGASERRPEPPVPPIIMPPAAATGVDGGGPSSCREGSAVISMPFPPAVAPWTPRARFDPAGNDIAQARYQNRKLALLTPAGSGSVQWKVQFSRRFKRVQRLQRIFRIYPPSSPRWGPAQKQQKNSS